MPFTRDFLLSSTAESPFGMRQDSLLDAFLNGGSLVLANFGYYTNVF